MPRSSVIAAVANKGFSPLNVSGLQLWLDASDETTITESSGAVSQWDDKSGNANHVSNGTAAEQPTTGTRTINSLNALDFDGGDVLEASPGVGITGSSNRTMIAVFEPDSVGNEPFMSLGANTSLNLFRIQSEISVRHNGANVIFDTAMTVSAPGIVSVIQDGSTVIDVSAWLDGVSLGVSSSFGDALTLDTTDRVDIGGANGAGEANGAIAEVLVYDSALSTTDREAVEAWLAQKWNITLS